MRFGQFFTEVCKSLRENFNWVGVETIVTERTQCLDVIHTEYQMALSDIQQSDSKNPSDELIKQRIYTTAIKVNQLKSEEYMLGHS